MLNLSKCIIELNESRNYWRLTSLIYGFTTYIIINCQLNGFIKSVFLLYLLVSFSFIYRKPLPYKDLYQLFFLKDEWRLISQSGQVLNYQKHRIILNFGLFFLLELKHETKRKVLVIFSDQLSEDHYRLLHLIEKIR